MSESWEFTRRAAEDTWYVENVVKKIIWRKIVLMVLNALSRKPFSLFEILLYMKKRKNSWQ